MLMKACIQMVDVRDTVAVGFDVKSGTGLTFRAPHGGVASLFTVDALAAASGFQKLHRRLLRGVGQ